MAEQLSEQIFPVANACNKGSLPRSNYAPHEERESVVPFKVYDYVAAVARIRVFAAN